MRKKHPFHCEQCTSECMIYKKGKNHRVLVCPRCGVLATNGKLGSIVGGAAGALFGGAGAVPGAVVGNLAEEGIKGLFSKKKSTSSDGSPKTGGKTTYDSLDKPNKNERYVNMALRG